MEALRLVTEFPFDAILTDLGMPRMNGIQLISYIKASEKNKETPIFVISGQDLSATVLQDLGVVRVLPKPFSLTELVSGLNESTARNLKTQRVVAYSPELTTVFKTSCLKVLQHYCGGSPDVGPAFIKPNCKRPQTYYSMIGLFGRRLYGSMALGCELKFLELILARLFVGQKVHGQEIAALAQETFLELLNQMAGTLKTELTPRLVPFNVGLPEFVHPDLTEAKHKISGHVYCLPLSFDGNQIQLELCLGHLGFKPEVETTDFNLFLTA